MARANEHNSLTVQTLVATMHQKDHSLVEKMNIKTDAIIVNQCDTFGYEEINNQGSEVLFMSLPERGVGLSRNTSLMRATADIVVFADDDVAYTDDSRDKITKVFQDNPKADMIMFNIPSTNENRPSPLVSKVKRIRRYNCLRYGTFVVAMRLSGVRAKNINFSLLFGGGAKYQSGEDSLFIWDSIKSGLRAYAVPVEIGSVTHNESTWFKGYDEKYFLDRGALFYHLSPKFASVLILQFALRKYRKIGGNRGLYQVLALMSRGRRLAKRG